MLTLSLAAMLIAALPAHSQTQAPEALIKQMSAEVLDAVKSDKAVQGGDVSRVLALVDAKVLPHVNFQRMTALSVGRAWREATPEQKSKLQEEFKLLLVRTYAGALAEVKPQTTIDFKPMRPSPDENDAIVRTEIRGSGEPIQLDYRLEKSTGAWKIYDVNVLGVWLVQNYRNSFAQEVNAGGVDGLIAKLVERNKAAAGRN